MQLRRITTSGRFIPEIDGLRFIAIITVVMYHLRAYFLERAPWAVEPGLGWSHVFEHGVYGVHLFFVISGFILALPFARQHLARGTRVSLRAYFLRRLTRLEPPYIICMLLLFVMHVKFVGRSASDLLPHLLASLAYAHNLIYDGASSINAVAWSLEVEIQFYLLVPLLASVFLIRNAARRRAAIVVAMIVIMVVHYVVAAPYPLPDDDPLRLSILGYLQFFLVGFLLADLYVTDWASSAARTSERWDLVTILGWPLLVVLWRIPTLSHWLFPALAFAVYAAALRVRLTRRVLSARGLTVVGGMCYTIYLLHYAVISFLGRRLLSTQLTSSFELELLWRSVVVSAVILGVSTVYFVCIERPCMRPEWPRLLFLSTRRAVLGTATTLRCLLLPSRQLNG